MLTIESKFWSNRPLVHWKTLEFPGPGLWEACLAGWLQSRLSVPCEQASLCLPQVVCCYVFHRPVHMHSEMMLTLAYADLHLQSLFCCHTEQFISSERHGLEHCEGDSVCIQTLILQLDYYYFFALSNNSVSHAGFQVLVIYTRDNGSSNIILLQRLGELICVRRLDQFLIL